MGSRIRSRTSKSFGKINEANVFNNDTEDNLTDGVSSRFEDDGLEEFRSDEACAALPNGKPPIRDQFDLMAEPLPVKGAYGCYPEVVSPPPNYEDNLAFQGEEPMKVVTRDGWVRANAKLKFMNRRNFGLRGRNTTTTDTLEDIDRLQAEEEARRNNKTFLWKDAFYDYTQNTTFHGIRLVFEDQPFFFRRIMWTAFLLTCASLFIVQMVQNGQYFVTYPVSVDVKINYNDSIIFPAVTVCNANNFRTTKAAELHLYHIINHIYRPDVIADVTSTRQSDDNGTYTTGSPTDTSTATILSLLNKPHNDTIPDLLEIFVNTSHTKADFIVSCTWDESPCSVEDFVTSVTDYGVCYTFNHGREGMPLKRVYQTGTQGGLRLQLNIEQYEYMRGPNQGAGVKILLHHPNDAPMVSDHGSAISPGSHGLVAVKINQVNNLEPNYGKCNDSVELEFYHRYSMATCYANCKELHILHKCGCRDVYMADKDGYPAVCRLDQFDCMKQAIEHFNTVRKSCYCPIPCEQSLYEPSVSYTTTSNFDIENLFRSGNPDILRKRYVYARETTERVDIQFVVANKILINGFAFEVHSMDNVLRDMAVKIDFSIAELDRTHKQFLQRLDFHRVKGLLKIKEMLESNFIRAHKMFDERSFHYATLDFYAVSSLVKRMLDTAKDEFADITNKDTRWLIYLPIYNMLKERGTTLSRAYYYMKLVNSAYTEGSPILTYELSYQGRYDSFYVSIPLLQSGASDQVFYFNRVQSALNQMYYGLSKLLSVGEAFVTSTQYDYSTLDTGELYFEAGGMNFNYGLYWFETLCVFKALDVINKIIDDFDLLRNKLADAKLEVDWKLQEVQSILDTVVRAEWPVMMNLSDESQNYLQDVNRTKTSIAESVTSVQVEKTINALTFGFDDVTLKMKDLKNSLKSLKAAYSTIWKFMLDDVHTAKFYEQVYTDSQKFLSNATDQDYALIFSKLLDKTKAEVLDMRQQDVVQLINGDFYTFNSTMVEEMLDQELQHISDALDLATHIANKQDRFTENFEAYKSHMKHFLLNNDIGISFFKENFMQLDVFLKELNYEEITQQKAYDFLMLMSDIGGLMGLFVGGSLISLVEFFDLFVYNMFRRIYHR